MGFKADQYITSVSGPLRAVKSCKLCNFYVSYPKGLRGVGRGYGLAAGGKAISEMRRHVRDNHAEILNPTEQ